MTLINGKNKYNIGQTVHHGKINKIKVGSHEQVKIYNGPSVGYKPESRYFYAGEYKWLPEWDGWFGDDKPKLVVVERAGFAPNELLKMFRYKHVDKKLINRMEQLEPGEWEADIDHSFRNDFAETCKIPKCGSATFYEKGGKGGRNITLQGGWHELKDFELAAKVSTISFKLDEWKIVKWRQGELKDKKKIGETSAADASLTVHPEKEGKIILNFAFERQVTNETHWELGSEISNATEVGGEGFVANVKNTITVTVSASGGGSDTKTDTQSFNVSLEAAPGTKGGEVRGQLSVERFTGKT